MPGSQRQNNMFEASPFDYKQKNNPFPVTSCGRRRNLGSPLNSNEPRKTTKGKGRNFRTVEEGAGMTAKGVASYKAKNPDDAKKYKIAVVPTIIIFKDGEEVARFQADLSFKMVATREDIQGEIDNQLMSDF